MSAPAASPALPAACPNCGAQVFGPYCAQCGQETVIDKLTLRTFGHEYLQNFVTLEGRLWRTLWLLLRHPGKLTTEFLAGRRRRYVRPLPLYFSSSFVLFLLMALFPTATSLVQIDDGDFGPKKGVVTAGKSANRAANKARKSENSASAPVAPASAASAPAASTSAASAPASAAPAASAARIAASKGPVSISYSRDTAISEAVDWPAWLRPLAARADANSARLNKEPDFGSGQLRAGVVAKLPYALFALVPAFALLTKLVYWRRRRNYAEHFLFALHLHSFVFLCLSASFALPEESIGPMLSFGLMAYLALALRTMFGGRLWPQVLRMMLLGFIHCLVLVAVIVVALLVSFLTLPPGG